MAGPKYDLQQLPTVAPGSQPVPSIHVDTRGAFGEEVGQGVEQLGLQGFHVALEAKAQADVSAVEDGDTQLQKHIVDTLYGDVNQPGSGFLKQKADNAVASSTATMEGLQKKRDQILSGLANGAQQEAFRRRSDSYLLHAQREIESHTAQQIDVSHQESFQAGEAQAQDTAARAYNNPAARAKAISDFEPFVMAEARRRGLAGWNRYPPPEGSPAAEFLIGYRQRQAGQILKRFIDNHDTAGAQAFLDSPLHAGIQAQTSVPSQGGAPHDLTRPVILNEDGTYSTEQTITVQVGDKHLVLPTVFDGQHHTNQQAVQAYRDGSNPAVGTFGNAKEADDYAERRHQEEASLRLTPQGTPAPAPKPQTVRDMLGQHVAHYEGELRQAGERADAYAAADRLVKDNTPQIDSLDNPGAKEPGQVNETAARAGIAALTKQLQPDASAQLEVALGHQRERWKQTVEERTNRAQEAYNAGGLNNIPGTVANWVKHYNPRAWRVLVKEAQQDGRERAEREPKPTEEQEDQAAQVAQDMVDHPEKYANLDVMDFRGRGAPDGDEPGGTDGLTRAQRGNLVNHLLTVHGVARKPQESVPQTVLKDFLVQGRAQQLLAKKGDPTSGAKAKYWTAGVKYILDKQNEMISTGKKPTPEDYRGWVKEVLAPVFVESTGFFGGKSTQKVARIKAIGDETAYSEDDPNAKPAPAAAPPADQPGPGEVLMIDPNGRRAILSAADADEAEREHKWTRAPVAKAASSSSSSAPAGLDESGRAAQGAQATIDADRERYQHLPYWEQRAEQVRNDERAASDKREEDRVFTSSKRKRNMTAGEEDEFYKGLREKVRGSRAERYAEVDKGLEGARQAYRAYYAANMLDAKGKPKDFAPAGFVDSFDRFLKLYRAGKAPK
jgi:hypothetical protein